jgi:D-inositol-3-phosphate glycosyltransferase
LSNLNSWSDQVKVAMVSAHVSPLNEASDPQGAHVARLSAALCRHGHDVTVYSRWDDQNMPKRVRADHGYEVVHVPAGPATRLADEDALPHIGAFTSFLLHEWATVPPDVVHGHLWMSGMVSVLGGRRIRVPAVQTFHSLTAVAGRHSAGDTGPEERGKVEVLVGKEVAHVAALNSKEMFELIKAGVHRSKISVVPGGVDIDAFTPEGSRARRDRMYRVVTAGPLLPHQSIDAVITTLSKVDGAELVITGPRIADDCTRIPRPKDCGNVLSSSEQGSCSPAMWSARRCPLCCDRPTLSSAHRRTSRPVRSCSRRWHAVFRSSPPRSVHSPMSSWTV